MHVLLANSSASVGYGLSLLLQEHGAFEVDLVTAVDEVFESVRRHKPDVIVVDAELPGLLYDEFMERLRMTINDPPVVVVLGSDDVSDMQHALQAGARAYLSVAAEPEELAAKLKLAGQGNLVVSEQLATDFSDHLGWQDSDSASEDEQLPEHGLSEREVEVLTHLARGATNAEIAKALVITENTVKVHVRNILRKLDLRNRQQAAAYALQNSLVADIDFHALEDEEEEGQAQLNPPV